MKIIVKIGAIFLSILIQSEPSPRIVAPSPPMDTNLTYFPIARITKHNEHVEIFEVKNVAIFFTHSNSRPLGDSLHEKKMVLLRRQN